MFWELIELYSKVVGIRFGAARSTNVKHCTTILKSTNMKRSTTILLLSAFFVGTINVLAHAAGDDHTFSYDSTKSDGPQHWGDLDPEWILCKLGREQSPINITTRNTYGSIEGTHLHGLNITYVPAHTVMFHDGHDLQLSFGEGNAGHFDVDGEAYLLTQLHFHSPSEHVVNGERAPLEMHLVHTTKDGQKTAVIGVAFAMGASSPFLDEFWGKLGELNKDEPNVEVDAGMLDLRTRHGLTISPKYARYSGSLTTPPCTQNITWTVSVHDGQEARNTISLHQLQALKNVLPNASARPLQSLYERVVYYRN